MIELNNFNNAIDSLSEKIYSKILDDFCNEFSFNKSTNIEKEFSIKSEDLVYYFVFNFKDYFMMSSENYRQSEQSLIRNYIDNIKKAKKELEESLERDYPELKSNKKEETINETNNDNHTEDFNSKILKKYTSNLCEEEIQNLMAKILSKFDCNKTETMNVKDYMKKFCNSRLNEVSYNIK